MCSMPECNAQPRRRSIKTNVPGTQPVILAVCPNCDTLRCGQCKQNAQYPGASQCPNGHSL